MSIYQHPAVKRQMEHIEGLAYRFAGSAEGFWAQIAREQRELLDYRAECATKLLASPHKSLLAELYNCEVKSVILEQLYKLTHEDITPQGKRMVERAQERVENVCKGFMSHKPFGRTISAQLSAKLKINDKSEHGDTSLRF